MTQDGLVFCLARVSAVAMLCLAHPALAQESPTFETIGKLFAQRCTACHSGEDAPLGLTLDSYAGAIAGSENGPVAIANVLSSPVLQRLRGETQPQMPLDGPPFLTDAEIALVTDWIVAGMPEGNPGAIPASPERSRPGPGEPVGWSDVERVFLIRCVKCHSDNSKLGAPPEGLRLDTLDNVLTGGDRLAVLPGNPEMSEIWRRVVGLGEPRMPFDGPPWLTDEDQALIRDWIAQGARDAAGESAPIPEGAELRLRGLYSGPNEIDGARFAVDGGTRIDDQPRVGDEAEVRGVVEADGTVRATRLRDR